MALMLTDIIVPDRKLALEPVYLDAIVGDIPESYADIKKAKYDLVFFPAVDLRHGLTSIIE